MKMSEKMEEGEIPELLCITDHQGFHAVCLNMWTLQIVYCQYQQGYGSATLPSAINEWVLFVYKDHASILDILFASSRRYRYILDLNILSLNLFNNTKT